MMQAMQSQVPQELSALMALQEGMQTGQVAPVTPEGTPTVAGQMAQAATQQMMPPPMPPQMPPQMQQGMPGMAKMTQQAGIAAQIQAMQQQKMQEAMMQQAAQATQRPPMMAAGGVASLNPRIREFAQGGIVGYAGDEDSAVIDPQFGGDTPIEQGEPRLYIPREGRRMTVAEMRAAGYPEEYIQRRLQTEGFAPRANTPQVAPQAAAPSVARPAAQPSDIAALREAARIPPDVQAARDVSGLAILQSELTKAQQRLAEGDPRAQGDIDAVMREIRRMSGAQVAAAPRATAPSAETPSMTPGAPRQEVPAGIAALSRLRPDYTKSDEERELALAAIQRAQPKEISPADVGRRAGEYAKSVREFLISQGRDPDYMDKIAADIASRAQERGGYYDQQAKEILEKQQRRGLATYLMGARGSGLGETLSSAAGAANRAEEAALMQSRGFIEKRFQIQEAAAKEKYLLDRARDEIARGQFDAARKTMEEFERARQTHERGTAELRKAISREFGERARSDTDREARVLERMYPTPSETERMLERLRSSGMPMETPEQITDALAIVRGAGRKTGKSRQEMLEQYADNWEKMEILEKNKLKNQGIATFEDYVKYRDRIVSGAEEPSAPIYAKNPKTGERIMSTDGGQTWSPVTPAR